MSVSRELIDQRSAGNRTGPLIDKARGIIISNRGTQIKRSSRRSAEVETISVSGGVTTIVTLIRKLKRTTSKSITRMLATEPMRGARPGRIKRL